MAELAEKDTQPAYFICWKATYTTYAMFDISGMNDYSLGMKSVVSEKGQVTIPKELRDRLGLRAGTTLDFSAEQGVLVARKAIAEDVFRKWRGRGRLPLSGSVDDYLRVTRGDE